MILGVNGIRLIGKRSGVARCVEAVLKCLGAMNQPFNDIRVYTPKPIESEVQLPSIATNVVLPSKLPLALWEQLVLLRAHGNHNVLFCPSYVMPLMAQCPTVLAHHGSYEGYPQAFDWWTLNKARAAYSWSAKRATAVSTVSEYSRQDMVRFYGMQREQIHVIPEGVHTELFRPIADAALLSAFRKSLFGQDKPYIVYVGKPTERRNLTPLVRAFASLKRNMELPHKMLIVGADLPGGSTFAQVIQNEGLASEVVVRGYASHAEMPLVYNAASLLVYPSSYEGFGMPVLEAMACGTPVIALNNTAFPEFAGGVALLLDDANVTTLAGGIKEVLLNASLRERMTREGPRRAAGYDWNIITRKYLDLMLPLADTLKNAA